ncbi:MAG: 50S ribosomal protein L18 [Deltaproteobacteria bacterium]|nr:50S ribosomal protein L18 [Deltaproteobacteria bacterium]
MFDDEKTTNRHRRQQRVRKRVRGSEAKPRLCVFRSAKHIYAQVISDQDGKTLVSASTLSSELRDGEVKSKKVDAAKKVGELVARRCLEQSISQVIFDRNGFLYHGRIKALADAAREAGLKF